MSVQLLAAIAQLCMLPGTGAGLFPILHEQLKCQQLMTKCVGSVRGANPKVKEGDALAACLMERKS